MMVPPLSERSVTEEDEEQFRRESMPRKYTLRQRWADYRADAKANRPKGVKARVRAWLHVEPFYWGMRVTYVVLVVGAVFAVYINGVAEGWWHAWGEKPTVAATTPTARPAPSASSPTDAAMSGGYQIGPDGVLVRPAEHAYAWNTGDTQPFEDITQPGNNFRETYINNIHRRYSRGWVYNYKAAVTNIVAVEAVTDQNSGAEPNTILVLFDITTSNGTSCNEQQIVVRNDDFKVSLGLFMTWKDGRWIETGGDVERDGQE